jgi:hypothetical protein
MLKLFAVKVINILKKVCIKSSKSLTLSVTQKNKDIFWYFYMSHQLEHNNSKVLLRKSIKTCIVSYRMKMRAFEILQ